MTDATMTPPDRSKRKLGNGASRSAPVLVSGNKLAVHFGVVRQRIDQLTAQGVIERRSDGLFDQDQSRLKYFDHLRLEHRRSPRAAADAELATAKAALLRIRIEGEAADLGAADRCQRIDRQHRWRHPDRIVGPAGAVRAARRSCDPAQYRARRVRDQNRDRQGL
jgi:predicted ArsR family transcriptional regulator